MSPASPDNAVEARSLQPGLLRTAAVCHHRGVRTLLAVTCGVCLMASEPTGLAQTRQRHADGPRFGLLTSWLDTVSRHEAGAADSPLLAAATWSGDDLRRLWYDIQVLVAFIERPTAKRYELELMQVDRQEAWRPPEATLTDTARKELDGLAMRVRALGLTTTLRRATVVHTDLIMVAGDTVRQSAGPARQGAAMRMNIADGATAGAESLSAHWEIARLIAARILRTAPADAFVRDWYRATLAVEQQREVFDVAHLTQALKMLPGDPVVLLLAGAQHEAFASPMFQAFRQAAQGLRMRPGIDVRRAELAEAERLLRRALQYDPAYSEARLRLGHVLAERGRHADAIRELTMALPGLEEPLLEYCALLFLGASHEALGAPGDARAVYERAATMTPGARVPHLALARLLGDAGEQDDAARHLRLGLAPTTDERAIDPWWAYRALQGRHGVAWLEAVRRASTAGTP